MNKISKALVILSAASLALSSCTPKSENNNEENSSPAVSSNNYSPVSSDMRDISSTELVSEIKIGWCLGNTLESLAGHNNGEPYEYETAWGNSITTRETINGLAQAGFNAVRIPVSWGEHLSTDGNYTIDKSWLDRVNEVVDYCLDEGMYVILNTHHEEWLFPDEAHFEQNCDQLVKIWTQIAERFEGYNEKLIFEGLNEPRKRDTIYEWNGGDDEGQQVVNKLNSAFVETIRGLGGNNSKRHLMIPTYAASSMEKAFAALTIPENDNKIIVSVHAYIPYLFALADKSEGVSEWNSDDPSCTNDINTLMSNIKAYFLDKNIPVIIGEMGAVNRDNDDARADWAEYYIKTATSYGVPCFWWDNGAYIGDGELFGIYSRSSGSWIFRDVMDSLMKGLE